MNKMSRKSKIIVGSLLGVAVLALTGVGVASWVIAGTTGATTGNVAVTVGDTEDKRIKIATPSVTDSALSFDAQPGDTTGPITAGANSSEDLNFEFNFAVTGVKNMASFTLGYSSDSGLADNGIGTLTTAVSENYLVSPISTTGTTILTLPDTLAVNGTVTPTAPSNATLTSKITAYSDTDTGTATIEVTCGFSWGTTFNSKNPCLIAENATDETITNYKNGLAEVYLLNAKKLYVVITPVAK